MRIGIVTTWFERGAAMVSRAYRDVLSGSHEVFIYARGGENNGKGDPNWDHSQVTWDPRREGPLSCLTWSLFKKWVSRRNLELILFNEQQDWSAVVFCRREFPVSIGAYVDYYTSRTVPFFNLYDFLLCNTRRHHSVFSSHPHALYIPWGTDCDLFWGNCNPVREDGIVFFHSAGMSPGRKGTETALRAFRMIKGPCSFLLHTQIPLSHCPIIAELCSEDDRIEVITRAVHAPGLYHRGDVYVYPSHLEGIGLSVPEALSSGLPAIVPDTPPMNEFVRNGRNGITVPPYEYRGRADGYYWAENYCKAEDVAKAMQYYVENTRDLAKLKAAARSEAVENLNWPVNAATFVGQVRDLQDLWRKRAEMTGLEHQALESIRISVRRSVLRSVLRRFRMHRYPAAEKLIYG